MKKGILNLVLCIILLIVLSYFVVGAHTATVFIAGPDSIYETNNMQFDLFVGNNPGSLNSIVNVSVSHPGLTTTSVQNPSSWLNDGDINWFGGLISDGFGGTFTFDATAQQINADTPFTWIVTTTDTAGAIEINPVTVTILNDSIAPSIIAIYPNDYTFVRNETIDFIVIVNESQTSVSPTTFNIGFDDNNPMQTTGVVSDIVVLTTIDGYAFEGSLDPNDPLKVDLPTGSKYLDYQISGLSDAAGNPYLETGFPHHIYIDIESPVVVLNQPLNGTKTTQYLHNVTFNMSDNSFETISSGFSPEVNCTTYINGDGISDSFGPKSYSDNINNAFIQVDLTGNPDNYYGFTIVCTDKVYLSTFSETRLLILDTTGPEISLNSPANGSIISNGTLISLSIIDYLSGIDDVWYNNGTVDFTLFDGVGELSTVTSIDTSDWQEGVNNIIVYANDTLGNLNNSALSFIVDKTLPSVSLVSPSDGLLTNGNVDFVFNATDNYDPSLDCQLWINGSNVLSSTAVSGKDTTFSYSGFIADGIHSWNVLCFDDVNPPVFSATRNVDVDMTPPELSNLTIFSVINNTNDDDGIIDLPFDVIDNNILSGCDLYINNVFNKTGSNANFTFNLPMSNNVYLIDVACNDSVGNLFNLPQLTLYYDLIAPNILNVNNSGVTTSNAIVSWNTDENANRSLIYWTDPNSASSSSVDVYEQTHSIPLSSLSSSTTYSYNVSSSDRWGNVNTTTGFSFTTDTAPASPGSSGGGGGGSGGGKCTEEWICTDWGACGEQDGVGVQTRVCVDSNDCDKEDFKPDDFQSCQLSFEEDELDEFEVEEEEEEEPVLTGFSIADVLESTPFKALIAAIIIGLIITGFLKFMKGRPPKHPKRINVEDHLKDEDTPFSIE